MSNSIQETADNAQVAELSTKLERWRYVDFKAISEPIAPATASQNIALPGWLADSKALVIDNGVVCHEDLASGWTRAQEPTISERLGGLASSDCPHQLACVNSKSNSVQLHVSGMADAPLLIVLRSSGGTYGLNIGIHAAAGSAADLIIVHDHSENAECNYAIHLEAQADSAIRIDEVSLHANSSRVYHHKLIDGHKNAQIQWAHMGYASAIDRHLWHARLHDIEAFCSLKSACIADNQYQAHHIAQMDHLSPQTRSEQLFKSIAMDTARYSFNGLVHMAKGADESASNQQNSNLQLSPKARIHSRPQLDIHTDDVIAAHGSATGPTDAAELYYLRTRGLSHAQAERIIVRGFLQEVTHDFHSNACRNWAAEHIIASLKD